MERAIPILPTDDLAAAKRFYVDGLGFCVTFEASEDGRTGLLGIERGTIELTLDSPMDGHGRNACVSLHVDDADTSGTGSVNMRDDAARRLKTHADYVKLIGNRDLRVRTRREVRVQQLRVHRSRRDYRESDRNHLLRE